MKCTSALDAVSEAVKVLEDSPLTNAGIGSNLCSDGTVECDASVMTGSPLMWAGIGALSDIKNPIQVARKLHQSQLEARPHGLVCPILLVGKGARDFAVEKECEFGDLITERARNSLRKCVDRMKKGRLDTVGAIAIAKDGTTASAASSGGILYKTPGRLGQASSFGSGCWSYKGVSVSTSGVGEFLILSQLGLRIGQKLYECSSKCDDLLVNTLSKSFQEDFIESPFLSQVDHETDRFAGVLALVRSEKSSRIEVACIHNTPSMVFAYQSKSMKSASCDLSRCQSSSKITVKASVV